MQTEKSPEKWRTKDRLSETQADQVESDGINWNQVEARVGVGQPVNIEEITQKLLKSYRPSIIEHVIAHVVCNMRLQCTNLLNKFFQRSFSASFQSTNVSCLSQVAQSITTSRCSIFRSSFVLDSANLCNSRTLLEVKINVSRKLFFNLDTEAPPQNLYGLTQKFICLQTIERILIISV